MQPFDYTTLKAVCYSLQENYIPSRLEQVYQCDRTSISLCLRNIEKKSWLTISWHPQAARICVGNPPPRGKDTFTFSDQLRHLINGYALIGIEIVSDWERVIDFQFAQRPNESPLNHLYVEIMGKYSNVILTNADNQIITVAKQVTADKSTLRTVETSQIYQLPPPLTGNIPKLEESQETWQEKVSLIPGRIDKQLIKSYRGISPNIAKDLLHKSNIDLSKTNQELTQNEWKELYKNWQTWLTSIEKNQFYSHLTSEGYTVLGELKQAENINFVINEYYNQKIYQENFIQLKQQLQQKIKNILKKLKTKKNKYLEKIKESDNCEIYSNKADLLMAHLNQWQVGMKEITLNDFTTGEPVKINLAPDKNMIQNAQILYKKYQKLKRAKQAVKPLLDEVNEEVNYLEQIAINLQQLDYQEKDDLTTLQEIKSELINQKYIEDKQYRNNQNIEEESQPRRYQTPSGYEVLVGRNNRQNDILTFKTATDYDLWFHAQEISGSHVLLRLNAGDAPEEKDLQFTANLAAYYSQGRESEQVPVVYTNPNHVYKPKGAKPGMVIYSKETVIWGKPLFN
ncbi:NFACT family protein [Cyanobacterium aponinum UTEX 3222]|uniref:Rqc2 family fibronectin-binding protein n=1 Tax=Cyanobacterium aponinum TaxID=379064 RepID=UPI002B4C2273|nr:NFACT family protein [Cyanobacterium aponinum]WRL37288.1 NFACT family protein [Cyanobacterium aponinum UTEX 3221]WRL43645.1 NFACT family protein [Cyanobacterium aponinum UTEX 3222]